MNPESVQACHELLLRLAGRLPDSVLWRYRDWLGEGALSTLARVLPRTLLKHDIDLDQRDHRLLVAGLVSHGADWHQVSSTLGVDEADRAGYTFAPTAPVKTNSVDSVSAVISAALRGRPDVGEVRECWRSAGDGRGEVKRILLVIGLSDLARLAGELQRVLRVLGEEAPSVEVLSPQFEADAYHRDALANSTRLCVGAVDAQHRLVAA